MVSSIMPSAALATILGPNINFPSDFNTNFLMALRWVHFLAGITWIGLLYFKVLRLSRKDQVHGLDVLRELTSLIKAASAAAKSGSNPSDE